MRATTYVDYLYTARIKAKALPLWPETKRCATRVPRMLACHSGTRPKLQQQLKSSQRETILVEASSEDMSESQACSTQTRAGWLSAY